VNVDLHLTDNSQLRAHGYVADGTLLAEVYWERPHPASTPRQGIIWGTPAMLRQLAALAVEAAIQAEEEACWHAHQDATQIPERGRVA
jgi:hypothetical protein